MKKHRIPQRIEYKYYVPLIVRPYLLEDLSKFTLFDIHAQDKKGNYKVASIYFENHALQAYHDKLAGLTERVKIRIRIYADGFTVCEFKYKIFDKSFKEKTKINYDLLNQLCAPISEYPNGAPRARPRAPSISAGGTRRSRRVHANIAGQSPLPSAKAGKKIKDPVLLHFFESKKVNNLQPFIRIDYTRKAFLATNDQDVRITFDYNVKCCRFNGNLKTEPHIPVLPPDLGVLEIKTPNYFPFWLSFIIKKYSLKRTAISKYALGVQNLALNSSLIVE